MRPRIVRFVRVCAMGALGLVAAAPAVAQGNSRHGPPPGLPSPKKPTPTPSPPTQPVTELQAATSGRRQSFGTWLDNADVLTPGEAWVSLYSVYWRSVQLREIDVPAVDVVVGIAPRVQIGMSVPYYHLTDRTAGTSFSGFGASYVSGKVALVQGRRVGVSVSPTLEILSWAPDADGRRFNTVWPASVQTDVGNARIYGTAGYFSRGSVFGSGAVELPVAPKLTLTTSIAHGYSTATDPRSDALGITRHRTDIAAGCYVVAAPGFVVFASAGRTFDPTDTSTTTLAGGVAFSLAPRTVLPPRAP